MDSTAHRNTVRQLADDLSWLEDHCRKNPELVVHAAHLRLASALTRNVIGPSVDGQKETPLFVAVVGGAGAGKSTVVNFLAGVVVADANPQAGFTRHPTAFVPEANRGSWPTQLGFLGPLVRINEVKPANVDEDVYQVKRLGAGKTDASMIDFVIWDCPDMTTWASANYVSRLMEVVALADVVVYVASDERYNDEVPTQFLHLTIQAGKPVVCCLTKMREADQEALIQHFRTEVLGKLPATIGDIPALPVVAIPNIPSDIRKDPAVAGAKYRVPLLNELLALAPNAKMVRQRTVSNAVKYLQHAGDGLLNVARRDLSELETWRGLVTDGQREFEQRYRLEYLAGEAFRRFDQTKLDVLKMLELPGRGAFVSMAFALVRKPYELLRQFVSKTITRPSMTNLGEQAVCNAAMESWLAKLQAEALRRHSTHPMWKNVTAGFDTTLKSQAQDLYGQKFRILEAKEMTELDATARAVPDALDKNPLLLNLLRGAIIAIDVVVILLIVWLTWPPSWWLLLLLPAVSVSHHIVEFIVGAAVNRERNKLRTERESLLKLQLTAPLQAWLADWPTSGGTSLERLQQVLTRIPSSIRELGTLTNPTPTTSTEPRIPVFETLGTPT
jgi:energy-coupling factor transporter ATP-binding protein EcfA2